MKVLFQVESVMSDVFYVVSVFGMGARGDAVGLGTALQAGRIRIRFLMVSLEFFIDIILAVLHSIVCLTYFMWCLCSVWGHAVVHLVEALRYKPEDTGSILDGVIGIFH